MKKTRLLEIIREEISYALKENYSTTEASCGSSVKEDQLNEMAWNIVIANPQKKEDIQAKIKDSTKKGEQKLSKALEILDDRISKGLKTRIRDISNEMGVRQQEINPLIGALVDVGVLEKGESVTGVTKKKITDKPQGRPSNPNKTEIPTDTMDVEDEMDVDVSVDMDDDSKSAMQNIDSDETAKKLGSTSEDKEEKFNLGLKFIKKYSDNKALVDAYLKKAKEEYNLTKGMLDDLKRAAGREV